MEKPYNCLYFFWFHCYWEGNNIQGLVVILFASLLFALLCTPSCCKISYCIKSET